MYKIDFSASEEVLALSWRILGIQGAYSRNVPISAFARKKKWLRPFLGPKNTSIFFSFFFVCVRSNFLWGVYFFFLFYPKDKKKSAKRWGPSTHHPRINRVFFVYLRPSGNNPKKDQKGDPQGDPLRQVLLRGIKRISTTVKCISSKNFYYSL